VLRMTLTSDSSSIPAHQGVSSHWFVRLGLDGFANYRQVRAATAQVNLDQNSSGVLAFKSLCLTP
jgi:hypothetical protein